MSANTLPQPMIPRWLSFGLIALLTLVAANLLAWRSIEPDLWGHIQYGEDWIHAGTMPRTATHTFASPDQSWINHENLFELSVAFGQRTIGGLGLMIAKCFTGLWLLVVMVRFALRRGVPLMGAVVAMIPTAWGLAEFWLMRPQLFSFVFFALMLLACERAFRDWKTSGAVRWGWLWSCVPLMVLWTNSHGGFLAGLCVLIALLGLRAVEALVRRFSGGRAPTVIPAHAGIQSPRVANALDSRVRGNDGKDGNDGARGNDGESRHRSPVAVAAHLALIAITAVASIFINPYGWELPYWMLISLSVPRPEISEWASIRDAGTTVIPFVVLSALTLAALMCSRRRRDVVELIVLGLIAVQPIGHIRHLAFFAIAFGFWMPEHLMSLWDRLVAWRPTLGQHDELTPTAARWLKVQLSAAVVGLCGLLSWTFATFGVDRSEYPVTAFEFMERERLHGKLVVTFDWAQYALAALTPATTVSFDGRYDTCYPQHIVDAHFDLLFGIGPMPRHRGVDSGPIAPERALEICDPDLVLLNRQSDVPAVETISSHPDWVLLYSDGLAGLWGRRSRYDDPNSSHWFTVDRRSLSDEEPTGIAAWPAFPGRTGRSAFSPDEARRAQERLRLTARE